MADITGLRANMLLPSLMAVYLAEPPGWTRLEPQSVSGEPAAGIDARVHDPLWLLGRQWQFGEFRAEDAGSPVAVHVAWESRPVETWQPGRGGTARALGDDLLEPAIGREPANPGGPGLRVRAMAGTQFVSMLADAEVAIDTAGLLGACALDAGPLDALDGAGPAIGRILAGRVPDGERLAPILETAIAGAAPTPPPWLIGDVTAFGGVAQEWLAWYRGEVAPTRAAADDTWIDDRLEHQFRLRLAGTEPIGLVAPAFGASRVDWHAFDATSTIPDGSASETVTRERSMQATPLRFAGMPVDRYWEFEDGRVNLGDLDAERFHLARLMLVEFAMVYGNDWLVVPVDVPFGSFTRLGRVSYTTTFGERFDVPQADDSSRSGRFRMFEISQPDSDATIDGLFVPPAAAGILEGPALEEVVFVRDEMANLAWAIERLVQAASGAPRSRTAEPQPPPFQPGADAADLDYLLSTSVPAHWIPLVPVRAGENAVVLRKGAMLDAADHVVEPLGRLLRPNEALDIQDEEIPREGVRIRRVPVLARRTDGSYTRWVTRRVTVGRGEGSSALAFDSAILRRG